MILLNLGMRDLSESSEHDGHVVGFFGVQKLNNLCLCLGLLSA